MLHVQSPARQVKEHLILLLCIKIAPSSHSHSQSLIHHYVPSLWITQLGTPAEKIVPSTPSSSITSVMLRGRLGEWVRYFELLDGPLYRQSLYDNEQSVQEYFALFWQQVANKFKHNPYVLGELNIVMEYMSSDGFLRI